MAIVIDGTGSITGLSAGGLPDGSITAADLASTLDLTGKTVTLPAGVGGKVLQVVQTVKTSTFTTTANTWTDITGYSCSITPSSTSNKILVSWQFEVGINATQPDVMIRLLRNSTVICVGDHGGTDTVTHYVSADQSVRPEIYVDHVSGMFLDPPSTTSSVTYKLQIRNWSASTGISVGRRWANTSFQAPSLITLMEIAA